MELKSICGESGKIVKGREKPGKIMFCTFVIVIIDTWWCQTMNS